jgi:hypothetical protein
MKRKGGPRCALHTSNCTVFARRRAAPAYSNPPHPASKPFACDSLDKGKENFLAILFLPFGILLELYIAVKTRVPLI